MAEGVVKEKGSDWKIFLRKHWTIVALFVVVGILAFIGAIYVYLWFVREAQTIGLVPTILGQWTMNHVLMFIVHLIFWEFLFIGIPVIIAAAAGWLWWRKLPIDEKKEYHFMGKRSRSTGGGGGVSFLFFIAFCIKVFVDGNWNVAIASWTLDYVVGSMITILVWTVVIFGIPAAVIGILWLSHEIKKKQATTADTAKTQPENAT